MTRVLRALLLALFAGSAMAEEAQMQIRPDWEFVADSVMGGVSDGRITRQRVEGRDATRLTGRVSLENNGGFVQMAHDLAETGTFDASAWQGIALEVRGNGETYDLRLRTDQLTRPWQSFRAGFTAPDTWTEIRLPFAEFEPNKTDAVLDPARLRRVGVLAIGREFQADIAVARMWFYR